MTRNRQQRLLSLLHCCWYRIFIQLLTKTMNFIIDNLLLPYRALCHRRLRNRREIQQFLHRNAGSGQIFGLQKSFSFHWYFVSVSQLMEQGGKQKVVLHWFEPSGAFISNIEIALDDIECIAPLDNHGIKLPNLRKLLAKHFGSSLAHSLA